MTTPFTVYDPLNPLTTLTNALLAANSGITVSNVTLVASGPDAVNFYDGSLASVPAVTPGVSIDIGAGLLLTSGTTPGTTNTVGWFGNDNSGISGYANGSASIDAVVNTVFQTQSFDATTLAFDFTVANPASTSISFDVVFGSDEYPEWVDQFVDCAVVIVNGVNYALFNHDPLHPLSVLSSNLAAGYFQDNTGNVLPIEYDGVSHTLKIVAPINSGVGVTNHIEIGISDTGDHVYDSGIFLANFSAGNIPGSGVVSVTPPSQTTSGNDIVTGNSQSELINLLAGDDQCFAGAGDDIVIAGAGNDTVNGGSGSDELKGDSGNDLLDGGAKTAGSTETDTAVYSGSHTHYSFAQVGGSYTVTDLNSGFNEGKDTLTNIDFVKFSDGLYKIVGNTLVDAATAPPPVVNNPGAVSISGVVMAGNTLTAIVVDADGFSTTTPGISYQWSESADGINWTNLATTKAYTLQSADAGKQIQVTASYVDGNEVSENPLSSSVTVAQAKVGMTIDPMVITAPDGASVKDPLTTLIKNAVDMGYTPNEASLAVKQVLGIAAGINIATYDAYAVLQTTPTDATAIKYLKTELQVAMTASMSDASGINMTLAVMNAFAANSSISLINDANLSSVGINNASLSSIHNLNKDMADAGSYNSIKSVWNDWAGKQDQVASFMNHIEKVSVHINQAPEGSASASLSNGVQGADYHLNVSDLLKGYSDPEGGGLTVSGLTASNGFVIKNLDGSYTIQQNWDFSGPVDLNYKVADPLGLSVSATQLYAVIIPNVTFVGTNGADTITGGLGNDKLYGYAGNDTLVGGAGNDLLNGGLGADSMTGGLGDDIYVVDNALDLVIENPGEGTDTVQSSIGYSLGANVENLTLTGSAAINGVGNELNNVLVGNSATNTLTGGDGNDTLNGGVGADTLIGGTGNDVYVVDNASDVVVENLGEGTDTVQSSISYTLGANLENLTLTGSSAINGIGNELNNSLIGNAAANTLTGGDGNDTLNGGVGADTLIGGTGNDVYVVDNVSDVVVENLGEGTDTVQSSIDYTLGATVENLTLTGTSAINGTGNELNNSIIGNAADNVLNGGDGNDTLNGGLGADTMTGGTGNDTYVVDNVGDIVKENAGEGTDTVKSSIDYDLGINSAVENLTLTGTTAIFGTGNEQNNLIIGNAADNVLDGGDGNDTLNGGVGADTMTGGTGNDVYVVDDFGDAVIEDVNAGTDTVQSSIDYALSANVENLTLTGTTAIYAMGNELNNSINGNSAENVLDGGDGNDTLNGGLGADMFYGGLGNDIYIVDNELDYAVEYLGEGVDKVQSSVTFSLSDNIENLTLTGVLAINGYGNTLDNSLTGNAASNYLDGGDGNDTLNGGLGADTMAGGFGNDTYIVDDAGDLVLENADEGTDLVQSSVTYTLSDNVEKLTLTGVLAIDGTGNTLNNQLLGNAAANTLTGGDGNDTLNGGLGADRLVGGTGNDVYVVDNVGDTVVEEPNAGTDTVQSSISYTLGDNVEYLTLTGVSAIDGTGNLLNNNLTGNAAANTLNGGTGNDTLIGGLGTDTLTGGLGNDIFKFNSTADSGVGINHDVITDFAAGDKINLVGIDANTTTPVDDAFSSVIVTNFSGVAGQLKFVYDNASGNGLLTGDVNGDSVADFEIALTGVHTLAASSLVL